MENRHIAGLDLLRFAAAAMVMFFHFGVWGWTDGTIARAFPDYPHFPELAPFAWFGWVGVQIFFLLSGFVICFSAERASATSFLRSRFVRLMPGIWICATITMAVASQHLSWAAYLKTLLILPVGGWVDGVYWTLCIEISFYAVVWFLLLIDRFSALGAVMAAVGVASSLAAFSGVPIPWIGKLLLIEHGCFFALGAFIYLGETRGWHWRLVAVAAFCTLGGFTQIANAAALKPAYSPEWIAGAVWLAGIAAVMVAIRFNDAIHRVLSAHISTIKLIGLATYPLYLIHSWIGATVIASLPLDRYAALIAGVAVSVASAIAIAKWLEPPAQAQIRGMWDAVLRPRQRMA